MQKGSKLYSILKNKCPRCMEASFFESNNPFKVKMNKHCANCGLDFSHEPGFYIGAMYVSYAQGVLIAVVTGLILYLGWHLSFRQILFAIALMLAITSTINFRLSRLVWINIWVRFDPNAASKKVR
jgi:uncharacterized protein (DUF983 family)